MIDDLLHGARCHYLTAMDTRTGADINNVVCVADSVLVVFHHEHRITEVPQMNQRAQQPLVVALVQTNGGFVEDVHDANQASTDLAGESNALCLTA